jgi:hypothetical protein
MPTIERDRFLLPEIHEQWTRMPTEDAALKPAEKLKGLSQNMRRSALYHLVDWEAKRPIGHSDAGAARRS